MKKVGLDFEVPSLTFSTYGVFVSNGSIESPPPELAWNGRPAERRCVDCHHPAESDLFHGTSLCVVVSWWLSHCDLG